MRVLKLTLGKKFLLLFLSFSDFFVKRPNGGSGCPDGKVDSSGRQFSLSGRACFYDLLRGTTSGRNLSSIRTMNLVGLYQHSPPCAPQPSHFAFLFIVVLCVFSVLFMHISHVHMSSL
jgi:hypothetical protein